MGPFPALPPEYAEMQAGMAEEEEKEPEFLLWKESDEYGWLADTGKNFILFYPLRFHGGFRAKVSGTQRR